jgi:cytidylate kinase
MKPAGDAVILDTSDLSINAVVAKIVELVDTHRRKPVPGPM